MKTKIVGAGLAGLIASNIFPDSEVFEAAPEPKSIHKALLRFRSDVVAQITGIPFKKVRVRKAVISRNYEHSRPTFAMANSYAKKCTGMFANDRSIWNLQDVDRYIAPDDFHERLTAKCRDRITYGCEFDFMKPCVEPIISTAPMQVPLDQLGIGSEERSLFQFRKAEIVVRRYRVPKCALYQTLYFADSGVATYRASVTGDILIIESLNCATLKAYSDDNVARFFGIDLESATYLGEVDQKFGKITPIDEALRRSYILRLTENNIYSLGRFATWRNLLLDDLVQDCNVIKRLINSDEYAVRTRK